MLAVAPKVQCQSSSWNQQQLSGDGIQIVVDDVDLRQGNSAKLLKPPKRHKAFNRITDADNWAFEAFMTHEIF